MSTHPLTRYRNANGLTLDAFAALIGASKGSVSKWERGLAEPRPKYRRLIADVTNGQVAPADLLVSTKVGEMAGVSS